MLCDSCGEFRLGDYVDIPQCCESACLYIEMIHHTTESAELESGQDSGDAFGSVDGRRKSAYLATLLRSMAFVSRFSSLVYSVFTFFPRLSTGLAN